MMFRFTMLPAVVALALAALLFGGTPVPAAEAANKPAIVAVVDVQIILGEATAMKSIQKQVEEKRSQFQIEISSQEKRLRDQEQELKSQRSELAANAFEAKQRDFEAQVASVQRDVQERRKVLDQAYGDGLKAVQKELQEVLAKLAKERGYTLVIPTAQLLYADGSIAITDEALKRLNKALPDVALQFNTASKPKKTK